MRDLDDQAIFPSAELFLIKRFMLQQGVQPRHWLLGTGLTPDNLEQTDLLVSMRQFDVVYRNVFRLSRLPATGMALGLAMNLSRWGVVATALLSAKTLGHALTLAGHYRALLRSRFTLTPEIRGDRVEISIVRREGMSFPVDEQFALEFLLGTLQSQISNLLAAPFRFQGLHLAYSAPSHWREIVRLTGCPVVFDSRYNRMLISRGEMTKPLPLGNSVVQKQALAICEDELERVNRVQAGDCVWQVRQALGGYPDSVPSMEQVAEIMKMSGRTLRRHLQASGACFRELQRQHQLQLALSALSSTTLLISQVAERAGFKDEGSFREAFRRWTQLTPSQYRALQAGYLSGKSTPMVSERPEVPNSKSSEWM